MMWGRGAWRFGVVWTIALVVLGVAGRSMASPSHPVSLLKTPNGGIQPQAVLDASGVLHLVYYTGDPAHGDIFYVHKILGKDEPFSAPLRVNSVAGSAVAIGTIRGAQLSVGRGNRVHVVWNGSDRAPKSVQGTPFLYSHLNRSGTAFEPERNLITWAGGIDGGGSIAAASNGKVYAVWHASAPGKDEASGGVYMARSDDNGDTFGREKQVNTLATGQCGCCAMRAFVDHAGALWILYRAAAGNLHRDTTLLMSKDEGRTFQSSMLQGWDAPVCPMSSFGISDGADGALGSWETNGQVSYARLGGASAKQIVAAAGQGSRKYPVVAVGAHGDTLFAWVDGAGWERGGVLEWRVYDRNGAPTAEHGRGAAVPVWSSIAAFARSDGDFGIIY